MDLKEPIEQTVVQLPYSDDPDIRETFADQCRMTQFENGAFHIEFAVIRPKLSAEGKIERYFVPSSRVVLSMQAATNLSQQLLSVFDNLEKAGILKRATAPGSTSKQ